MSNFTIGKEDNRKEKRHYVDITTTKTKICNSDGEEMGHIVYTFSPGESFAYDDIRTYLNQLGSETQVIEILSIYVKPRYRNLGVGTELINEIISRHGNHYLIFTVAGLSCDVYTDEPFDELYDVVLEKLSHFYKRNNFINVNAEYGAYEFKETYVLNNKIANDTILNIHKN